MLMLLTGAEEVRSSWFGKDTEKSITGRLFFVAVIFKHQLSCRQEETCHWNAEEHQGWLCIQSLVNYTQTNTKQLHICNCC